MFRVILLAAGFLVSAVAVRAETTSSHHAVKWPDPARYEKVIRNFETTTPATAGAVLAYGSSSIVGWHKWIKDDLKPLTIVPRGFGGSNMNDALHFMDRVIVPAKPRAVLLYEGDNDVASGAPNEAILEKYVEFIQRLQAALPDTRLYILSVKPSISRWKLWPQMKDLNEQLRKLAEQHRNVTFVDVASPMLAENGEPKPDIFLKDNLHMNRKGYDIWRDTVKAALTRELEAEKQTAL